MEHRPVHSRLFILISLCLVSCWESSGAGTIHVLPEDSGSTADQAGDGRGDARIGPVDVPGIDAVEAWDEVGVEVDGAPGDVHDASCCSDELCVTLASEPCLTGHCDPETCGCVLEEVEGTCDDGDLCTGDDHCNGGACVAGAAVDCGDGDPCTDDWCLPAVGCLHGPVPCDDGLDCTEDGCVGELGCVQIVLDGWGVEDGQCVEGGSVVPGPCMDLQDGYLIPAPDGLACEDGDLCTEGTLCQDGVCVGGWPVQCPDGDITTTDFCVPISGCVHEQACDVFQINLVADGNQGGPAALGFDDGSAVVVWRTGGTVFDDALRISFRRFGPDGAADDEEVEVLPATSYEEVYGQHGGLRAALRVGVDRFLIQWNLGTTGQGYFQLFDQAGQAVSAVLQLPGEPFIPDRDPPVIPQCILGHDPAGGFLRFCHHMAYPSQGIDEGASLEGFNADGELTAGPVQIEDYAGYSAWRFLGHPEGFFWLLFSDYGGIWLRRYDSTTLAPLSEAVLVPALSDNCQLFNDVEWTPTGMVVTTSNGYGGAWIQWLDPNGQKTGDAMLYGVPDGLNSTDTQLAVFSDGRLIGLLRNQNVPNGLAALRFTAPEAELSGLFSVNCDEALMQGHGVSFTRLSEGLALATWPSYVSDGDGESVHGRLVSWD